MADVREILVVDDERGFGEMLRTLLTKEQYAVTYQPDPERALENLATGRFAVVLCDVKMPRLSGQAFLQRSKERGDTTPIIMMSAYGTIDTVLECMKLGAYDYIGKPFKPDELVLVLRKLEEREGLRQENQRLKRELQKTHKLDNMVGRSAPMRKLFEIIQKVADYKSTVLITGESGTGKELVARALHYNSGRAKGPFIAVNCGAIPEQLLESELFGYVKGAFTDARSDKRGLFAEANGGTLFLDEIGELPLPLQVKLLRVIQEEEVRRVGDTKSFKIDVRIVAATIRNLSEEVDGRRFRQDLFYRLNVLPVHIPPLRERPEDIPLLVEHFLKQSSLRLGKKVNQVDPEAMRLLTGYPWPGNVRELENTVERACVFADKDTVTRDVLPDGFVAMTDRVRLTLDSGELSIKKTTRIIENELITRALHATGGNRTVAARLLEISHRALLYKIKEYEIDIPPR
ncbi:MAG: sigma-54-dependent Fis family transcriptional regulator [Myxococcales bacterium]|nr:sigma-54-dependent Fis family transcriptional regulator [Myxococcales bacterium]